MVGHGCRPTTADGAPLIRVANAPVSFGVFELTEGRADLPHPDSVLEAVASAGYDGIDLGPVGYLGRGETLRHRLQDHGLALAGGWIQLRLTDPVGLEADLEAMEAALSQLAEARQAAPDAPAPRPTLADAGSPARAANPGAGRDRAELWLDDDGWRLLAAGLERAVELCRSRDLEPTFHHHACTYVEAPHEIERLLELTDVGLCLDSGHLLLGGGDPTPALKEWGDRINHVHLKDARVEVLEGVVRDRAAMEEVWRRGAFCRLGDGDLDVDGFLDALLGSDYSGWVVVEQDRLPAPGESPDGPAEDQRHNRRFLRRRGL